MFVFEETNMQMLALVADFERGESYESGIELTDRRSPSLPLHLDVMPLKLISYQTQHAL